MKLNDFIFRFECSYNHSEGICRVRTFINNNFEIYVVLSELDENPSESVTNALELIVNQLLEQEKISSLARIIEHCPKSRDSPESFDLIIFNENQQPTWSSVSFGGIIKRLECSAEEFDDYKRSKRVQKEICNALDGIPKNEKFEYTEPHEITERRLEIIAKQHSAKEIIDFLKTSPSEAELSDFINKICLYWQNYMPCQLMNMFVSRNFP